MVALISCFLLYLAVKQSNCFHNDKNTVAAFEDRWQIKPVIGIIAQEAHGIFKGKQDKSYIPAGYVKYIEAAGGVALPIRLNRASKYYKKIFENVNGVLLPGGEVSVETSEYARISRLFFDWAKEANDMNDTFPILGVCLGFEQLLHIVAEKSPLTMCRGRNYNTNLIPTPNWEKCGMLRSLSSVMADDIVTKNITYNYHQYCVEPHTFNSSENLKSFFYVGAVSLDLDGLPYIAYAEARTYPFYAFQWHPERPIFEWGRGGITHDRSAIQTGQHFANHFMHQAAKSRHEFREKYFDLLIYNHTPVFTGSTSPFMQAYFFDDFSRNKNY